MSQGAPAFHDQARQALEQGDFKVALGWYRRLMTDRPRSFSRILIDFENLFEKSHSVPLPGALALAHFLLSQGHDDEAIAELEEAIELYPRTPAFTTLLGQMYLNKGRTEDAIRLLERALHGGTNDISLSEMLAGAYLEQNRSPEAIALYESIVTMGGHTRTHLRILGDLYIRTRNPGPAAAILSRLHDEDPDTLTEVRGKLDDLTGQFPKSSEAHMSLADAEVKGMSPEKAVKHFRAALRINPGLSEILTGRMKRILELYPDHPESLSLLGELLRVRGLYSEAAESYKRLLHKNASRIDEVITACEAIIAQVPAQVMARELLAEAYRQKGLIEPALLQYRELLKLSSEEADMIIKRCRDLGKENSANDLTPVVLAEAYLRKGDNRKAIDLGETLVAQNPRHLEGHRLIGEGCERLGLYRKSVEAFRAAIALDENSAGLHRQLEGVSLKELDQEISALQKRAEEDPWRVALHIDLAKLYLKRGQHNRSIRELQQVVKDPQRAATGHHLMALAFKEEGRFDLAELQLGHALTRVDRQEEPELTKLIMMGLGSVREALGQIDAALEIFEELYQEDIDFGNLKRHIRILQNLHPVTMRHKMLVAATSPFRKEAPVIPRQGFPGVIALFGTDHRELDSTGAQNQLSMSFGVDHNAKGFDLFLKGRGKAAEEEFMLATTLDPTFAAAQNNLGVAALREGRTQRAIEAFEAAMKRDIPSAILHNNLGLGYLLLDQPAKADKQFRAAIKLDPALAASYVNFGDTLYALGQVKEAIACYRKVKEFDPLFEIASRRLLYKSPS